MDKEARSDSIKTLKELCLFHGEDPTLHLRLADLLKVEGRDIAALLAARKAYSVLRKENPREAGIVIEKFGNCVTIDDDNSPIIKTYLPLESFFPRWSLFKHKFRIGKGDILFYKGEPADSIYLLLEGSLAANTEVEGVHSLINYLHAGSLVGRSGQEFDKVRNSTVVAMQDSTLLRFTRKELKEAFTKNPDLHIQFSKESLMRSRVEMLSSSKHFSRLPIGLRFIAASRCWTTTYKVGEVIKESREHMQHVALIIRGVFHLYDEPKADVPLYCGRMSAGQMMGLYRLMHQQALSLVIKAETSCEVLCFSFADIEDLMDAQPALRQKLSDEAVSFSQQMTRTILLQKDLK